MNEDLINALQKVLADTFVMYYKTHTYHWNVEGPNFPQYHDFFGDLYGELFGAVDSIAEKIRQLDGFPPTSLTKLKANSMLSEDDSVIPTASMITRLLDANNLVLVALMRSYEAAEAATEIGVSNFIQDRIMVHQKHGWMLKAMSKV